MTTIKAGYLYFGGIAAVVILFLAGVSVFVKSTLPTPKPEQLTPAKMVTATDSCGCKVFTVEVKGRTFVVNNQGGIWLVPEKDEGGDPSLKMLEQLMDVGGGK